MGSVARREESILPAGGQETAWDGGASRGQRSEMGTRAVRGGQLRLLQEATFARALPADMEPQEQGPSDPESPMSAWPTTLSAYLAGLRVGAPCFACGAGPLTRATGAGSRATLSCPRCGAEIETFDSPPLVSAARGEVAQPVARSR